MVESERYHTTEGGESYIKGSGKDDKKRRFSEEQVKSMELTFETQTKLEPRKKMQLAKELGLHPRQVAIWFQNKRARWKSKQLEREYNALRADYEALLSNFASVKNEKQLLAKQLKKLGELADEQLMKERGKGCGCSRAEEKPNSPKKEIATNCMMRGSSDDEESRSEKEMDFFSELPMESERQRFSFHQTSWPSDQSDAANSQWWEFWPMNE